MIEDLPKNYIIYINLRERTIPSYEDFLEAIFDVKYEGILTKIMRFLRKQIDIVDGVISELGKIHKVNNYIQEHKNLRFMEEKSE